MLVAELSHRLVAATSDRFDPVVESVLTDAAVFLGADVALLCSVDEDAGRLEVTHLWTDPLVGPLPGPDVVPPTSNLAKLAERLGTTSYVILGREDVENPRWLDALQARAVVLFAIRRGEQLTGIFAFMWRHLEARVSAAHLEPVAHLADAVMSALDRQRIERVLRASEERFRLLAEHSSDFTFVYDADGQVRYLSPTARRFTGRKVGTTLHGEENLVHPEDREQVVEVFRALRAGEPHSTADPFEARVRRSDGTYRWMEIIATNLLTDDAVRGFVLNARDVTDRRSVTSALAETNQALWRSNATLQAIIENSPMAIFAMDNNDVVTVWNPACERVFGWTATETIGRQLPQSDLAEYEPLRKMVLAGEVVDNVEATRRTKDGPDVALMFSCAPLRDGEGQINGVIVMCADISGRVDAERALRESEERFRALVQNTSDLICLLDEEGRVRYASPAGARMMGRDEGFADGDDPMEHVHPDDIESVVNILADVFTEPGVQMGPVRVRSRHSDGSYRHIEAVGVNLLEDPAVRGIVITGRDVTENVHAEEALRESEERFRALVQNLSDVITVTSPDGQLVYTSPASERLFGFTEGDATWADPLHAVHPDDRERVAEEFGQQLSTGAPESVAFRLRAVDGRWHHVEAVARDLTNDPAVGGLVVTTRDVTERKRAEAMVAAQARVLRGIAQGAPLVETLATICSVVEGQIDGSICSVMLVDEPTQTLRLAAAGLLPDAFADELHAVPISPTAGTCGTAAYRGEPVVTPDIVEDPSWDPWRELALSHGLRACWSTPVLTSSGDRVLGTLAVYAPEPRSPGTTDEEVVALATHLAAIAVERRAYEDRLAHQAHHDPLTELPNRALFVEFLTLALARARRHHGAVAVLFLDLDRFKVVNDSLGHDAGDEVLVKLSERLRRVVRLEDTVARFGGDEFTVLCEDLPAESAHEQAIDVARRILDAVEMPFELRGEPAHLSASIGIALTTSDVRAEALLRDADAAMYRAKERGKGRWEVFDEVMRSTAKSRLDTERALHGAIERSEFCLYFQPVIEISSGQCVGAEALLRWQHPERGLVGPDSFIGLAEETGLIVPIGLWTFEEAARQLAHWSAQGWLPPGFSLAVNLSARQVAQADLVARIDDIFRAHGVPPSMLTIEITESVLMAEATVEPVRALHALGMAIAIDDFGTGYSSLGYLKRFPVDLLKIDRSFVDGLGRDAEDSAIVTAVVSLGHALGLTVVAEGVEKEAQLAELAALGCDRAQGFLLSHPKPIAEFVQLLEGGFRFTAS